MRKVKFHPFSPFQHLAADEWLLAAAERNESSKTGTLRIWESDKSFVVLGRGSKVDAEVNQEACAADKVSILRRTSGGATIVTGPGCLMYSIVLEHASDSRIATIDATHNFVLETMAAGLNTAFGDESLRTRQFEPVEKVGTSDLALRKEGTGTSLSLRKFSGNAMRRGRNFTLYHGTLLYDFDLSLISRYLQTAPRQPEYRQSRDHDEFVTNLPLNRSEVISAVESAWQAGPSEPPPSNWLPEIDSLVAEKYAQESWNLRH